MGTYSYRAFRNFPYLVFRSPTKRCGKSRVLDLLSLVAFNASPRVTNPTEAQLFRGPSKNSGTLLLDQDGVYYGLDAVGARIWNLIQEPRTMNEVHETLLKEYDVEPDRCERDLLALLQELAAAGLIEIKDEATP